MENDLSKLMGGMSITVLQQSGHEWSWSVKQIWRLVKGRTYRTDLRCSGLAEFWDERAILSLSADKKTLYRKTEWRSKERVEKSEDTNNDWMRMLDWRIP